MTVVLRSGGWYFGTAMCLVLVCHGCQSVSADGDGGASPTPVRWQVQQPSPDPYAADPVGFEAALRAADVRSQMDQWPGHFPPIEHGLIEFVRVRLDPPHAMATHEVAIEMAVFVGSPSGTSRRLWIRRMRPAGTDPWRGPFVLTAARKAMLTTP